MPILIGQPVPLPVTQQESDQVLALVKLHASASTWKALVKSLQAKPDPYPFQIIS
jgi:hypothetical protein